MPVVLSLRPVLTLPFNVETNEKDNHMPHDAVIVSMIDAITSLGVVWILCDKQEFATQDEI